MLEKWSRLSLTCSTRIFSDGAGRAASLNQLGIKDVGAMTIAGSFVRKLSF